MRSGRNEELGRHGGREKSSGEKEKRGNRFLHSFCLPWRRERMQPG